jgi:hypothetical protein
MPDITTASLFGIRILCKAGCKVVFDDATCQVIYDGIVILKGYKDPVSNLWTLPVLPSSNPTQTSLDAPHHSSLGPCMSDALREIATFLYHRATMENNVKFMHQSLSNPPKMSLLTAICHGFLRGAPHLTIKAVTKYLPPSPATSKGHMKRPRQGICSTTPKQPRIGVPASVPDPMMPSLNEFNANNDNNDPDISPHFSIIDNVDNNSIANIFCFRAFANKITGVFYNALALAALTALHDSLRVLAVDKAKPRHHHVVF